MNDQFSSIYNIEKAMLFLWQISFTLQPSGAGLYFTITSSFRERSILLEMSFDICTSVNMVRDYESGPSHMNVKYKEVRLVSKH